MECLGKHADQIEKKSRVNSDKAIVSSYVANGPSSGLKVEDTRPSEEFRGKDTII